MIYLISDIHGDVNFKGLQDYLRIATEKDLLIVLGDICVNFEKTEENALFSDFFLSIKKNIAFIGFLCKKFFNSIIKSALFYFAL